MNFILSVFQITRVFFKKHSYFFLFFFCFILISSFALQTTQSSFGDISTYTRVAHNIYQNHCVSLDNPQAATCAPHWGGNQLPGYPLIMAIIWGVFQTTSQVPIVLFATFLYTISIFRLFSLLYSQYGKISYLSLLLFISPLHIGWLRVALTESIVLSLYILLFSELLSGLFKKKFNYIVISLLLVIGFWIRYDFILVLALIFGVFFYSIGLKKALMKSGILFLIILLSFSLWSYRSLSKDLKFSEMLNLPKDSLSYLKWFQTWSLDSHADAIVYWSSFHYNYYTIHIPERAYWSQSESKEIKAIMTELQTKYIGKPMPDHIQRAFVRIATEKKEQFPFRYYVTHPLQRLVMMTVTPYSSFGMPIIFQGPDKPYLANVAKQLIKEMQSSPGLFQKFKAASQVFDLSIDLRVTGVILFKLALSLFRYVLILGFLGLFCIKLYRKTVLPSDLKSIRNGLALYFIALHGFWIYLKVIEVRYQLPLYIMIQLFLITYFCCQKASRTVR